MLRRLFTVASALSLLLCLCSTYIAVSNVYFGGGYTWDETGQWVAVPHLTLELAIWVGAASAIMFGLLPGFWVKRFIKDRHERACGLTGTCATCGYDLRASKDRCPECGMPIPLKATA